MLTVTIGRTQVCESPVSGGNWSCTSGIRLIDGVYNVVVQGPGNVVANGVLRIDTVAPLLTFDDVIDSPVMFPVLRGTTNLEQGGNVTVADESGTLVCEAAVADNIWSCVPERSLQGYNGVLTAVAIDEAGNRTEVIAEVSVTAPGGDAGGNEGGNRNAPGSDSGSSGGGGNGYLLLLLIAGLIGRRR